MSGRSEDYEEGEHVGVIEEGGTETIGTEIIGTEMVGTEMISIKKELDVMDNKKEGLGSERCYGVTKRRNED